MQLVLVAEFLDGQVLETLIFNSQSKVLKHCVYNCRGRALERMNVDILRGFLLLSDPLIDSVSGVLYEALVHHLLVQLDNAVLNVLGALQDDFSLVRQERERDVVDTDSKFIRRSDVED